jgi:excisionase family DNA binding protein
MSASKRPIEPSDRGRQGNQASGGRQEPQEAATRATGLTASQLLTPEQLAERLQVSKSQVYRLTRAGHIPVVKLGKYYRFRKDEIDSWERNGGTP